MWSMAAAVVVLWSDERNYYFATADASVAVV